MRGISLVAICVMLLGAYSARAEEGCARVAEQHLPQRPADAMTGSAFASEVASMSESDREEQIRTELLAGNIPSFVRHLVPVVLEAYRADGRIAHVTVCVLSDYLAVGSDRDFLYVPMRLATALNVAGRYGFTLPTTRLVDAIYSQAAIRLAPQPLPACDQMRTTAYYVHHNALIAQQRASIGAALGLLTAGHKKDLVIANRLWTYLDRVAIYGWHRAVDSPIQPLSTVHGAHYADYSHGVRLVSETILVDGKPMALTEALADPALSMALTGEDPIPRLPQLIAMLAQPRFVSTAMLPDAGRQAATN